MDLPKVGPPVRCPAIRFPAVRAVTALTAVTAVGAVGAVTAVTGRGRDQSATGTGARRRASHAPDPGRARDQAGSTVTQSGCLASRVSPLEVPRRRRRTQGSTWLR
ncbi:hypothetical protein GCM10011594_10380 [Nakamurella endophytica]|uniref:Uncharacterized protein n=1 Tax=Nakamurella endophytica TaxID=1748367 RepID=A0A917WCU6_9ACTN|nr:hypothetical protein GCM10011594_10380 [Nakamurella endophytica]